MNGKQEYERTAGISASSLVRWERRDRDQTRAKRRAERREQEYRESKQQSEVQ